MFSISYHTYVHVEKIQRESARKSSSSILLLKVNFGLQVASTSLFCTRLLVFIFVIILFFPRKLTMGMMFLFLEWKLNVQFCISLSVVSIIGTVSLPLSWTKTASMGKQTHKCNCRLFYILEKEMTIYSSILTWKIPWTEKPGGPESM